MEKKSSSIEIGKRVKQLRRNNELTQGDFGEKVNLSRTAVCSIEKGHGVSHESLTKIAEAFNVDLNWLLLGNSTPVELNSRPNEKASTQMNTGNEYIRVIEELVQKKDQEIEWLRSILEKMTEALKVGKPEVLELPGVPNWGSTPGTMRPAA